MENKEKKPFLSTKTCFWLRFVGWILLALIIPCGVIIWKFNLFQVSTKQSITFGGWGIICVIILFFVVRAMINYVRKGLPYSMATQLLNGFVKVLLPIIVIMIVGYILLTTFSEGLTNFLIVMGIILGCEAIAIPLNPFPKLIHDKKLDETKGLFSNMLDEWEKRKEEKNKK